MGIIKSILDLDLYKITMLNAVILKYPDFKVKSTFTDRKNLQYPAGFDSELLKEVQCISKIKGITKKEAEYLRVNIPWISEITVKYLMGYSFNPSELIIAQDAAGHLAIKIEGYYHSVILWETILMSIVSELYFKNVKTGKTLEEVQASGERKSRLFAMNNQRVVDMGTRRRRSYEIQDATIKGLFSGLGKSAMIGTSNVHFAMKYNIKPIGTVAHEWYMFHSALFGYKMANRKANDVWAEVYRGELGIGLTDTFTTNSYLESFDSFSAKLQDGLRQDSGDPNVWFNKIEKHYKSLGIDPKTKHYIFSDSISSHEQLDALHDSIPAPLKSYGIGTWLSNDFGDALKIVIKLTDVLIDGEWVHVVKLSDEHGKESGNFDEILKAKMVLGLNEQKSLFS